MMKMLIFAIMMYKASILFMILLLYFLSTNKMLIIEWLIFNNMSMKFNMLIIIDYVTMSFLMIVTMISSFIMFYSLKYMKLSNNNMKRFHYLMMLFIMSMYLLIISPSMLTIIIGWDGLGLISFCLVTYYQNYKAMNAGMMTIVLNRIGDVSLLILMGFICMHGSWNLMLYKIDNYMMYLVVFMVLTKSAQMPFSYWLPEAMMAPTPVSALVHSSTLVTAGVYLMFRYDFVIPIEFKEKLMFIFSTTMLMAGLFANFEMDLKKIVALSTMSQLSFMLLTLSANFKELAIFHLFIHALFKSLMFMCVGSYIHYNCAMQDIRDYNNMLCIYPVKKLILFFTLFSLMGFPFLLGFYSKDLIMDQVFFLKLNSYVLINISLSMVFTISYSMRIIYMMMFKKFNPMKMNLMFEDKLMNIIMALSMFMSMLFAKYYYEIIKLMYHLDLSFSLKLMLSKFILIGLMYAYMNYKKSKLNKKSNKIFASFSYMNYLNKFFKLLYMFILNATFEYDMIIEKKFIQLVLNEQLNIIMSILNKFIKKDEIYFFSLNFTILLLFMIFMIVVSHII